MKQLLAFIRKEFYHVFRDRRTLLIMFGMPVAQIILFGFALTSEVRNASVLILDKAKDANSYELINKLGASSYFTIENTNIGEGQLNAEFRKGKIKAAILIPSGFGDELKHN